MIENLFLVFEEYDYMIFGEEYDVYTECIKFGKIGYSSYFVGIFFYLVIFVVK